MKTPLAKLTAPVPAAVVDRPRLYRAIDEALAQRLTWIAGPAGCGKTTLLARYVQIWDGACLWYQADASDADPGSPFHYLRLAAQQAAPRSRKALPPAFAPEYLSGITVFARRFFRALFARLKPPFLVVFDNINEVPAEALFHTLIREGAAEVPRGGHLVLISRSELHPCLARFRASRELAYLGWEDLRFSAEEAQDFLALVGKQHHEPPSLARLLDLTQGWAAGLVLLTHEEGRAAEAQPANGVIGETLFDYFAIEVFNRIEPARQDFLLKTAFLPKITAATARDLTGNPEAEHLLNALRRRNFFTIRRPDAEVYEYHPLFREFLQKRAEALYPAMELAAIKRATAATLIQNEQINEAVRLILEFQDWQTLERLVEAHAPGLLSQARHRTLEAWLESVPEPVLAERPWLRYWLGRSWMLFKPAEAQMALSSAYRQFRDTQDAAGAFLAWAAIVEVFVTVNHYSIQLDPWLDEFESLRADHPEYPSLEIECLVTLFMLAALASRRPWHPDVGRWNERALVLAEQVGNINLQIQVCFHRFHVMLFSAPDQGWSMLLAKLQSLLNQSSVSEFNQFLVLQL